ncbi:hypothetical protein DACRYDRAFT_120038 [Dacryopinax primogenitus]|uniref:Uncharacterized protein n=1 Tax=Dacryopinax primogenitus (strain DJM 731) TaxID=1858805 RepID=M5FMZ3_DACPD|nr:uncharacterized protein DACRYDRAFT_120038 [Dacryopinax primogenitus]EJT96545.1 hypothetical protein DACRYDRAFT_120038 [Dacryopinax primogenitus]
MSTRPSDRERDNDRSWYRDGKRYDDKDVTRLKREDGHDTDRAVTGSQSRRADDEARSTQYEKASRSNDDNQSSRDGNSRYRRSQRDDERFTSVSLSRGDKTEKWGHDQYERDMYQESRRSLAAVSHGRSSLTIETKEESNWSVRRSTTPGYKDSKRTRADTPEYDYRDRKDKVLDRPHTVSIPKPSIVHSSDVRTRAISPSPPPTRSSGVRSHDDYDRTKRRSRSPRRRDDSPEARSRRRRDDSDSEDSDSSDPEYERRPKSSGGNKDSKRDRERRKEREREKRKEKKKARKESDKDERRSVLTGKKIKLKVHKDAEDVERDKRRENLLQFLNSAYD